MLSGRSFCPCGHNAVLIGRPGAKYYQCSETILSKRLHGKATCQRTSYAVNMVEQSVVASLVDAASNPEALAAAVKAYQERPSITGKSGDFAGLRAERSALNTALLRLGQDEAAAVQGQIAGIQAGASPDAYRSVFVGIAARRKELEERRGTVERLLAGQEPVKTGKRPANIILETKALEDMVRVLSSDTVPGHSKRDLIGTVIDRVVCQSNGATIFFLPGLVSASHQLPPAVSETFNSTLIEYSIERIQIVCRVRAGFCQWLCVYRE